MLIGQKNFSLQSVLCNSIRLYKDPLALLDVIRYKIIILFILKEKHNNVISDLPIFVSINFILLIKKEAKIGLIIYIILFLIKLHILLSL